MFDADPGELPAPVCEDLLAESGKGLAIVAALAEATGTHRSRSRLRPVPVSGKVVWFSLALPDGWPVSREVLTPWQAGRLLLCELCMRGLFAAHISDLGVSTVVTVEELRVEITNTHYTRRGADDELVRVPLAETQDAIEGITARIDSP
ncbi:hypothetical protein AB0L06_17815 [Spirillospora sp. NPDC052269]